MKKIILYPLIVFSMLAHSQTIDQFKFMSEDFPPYNYRVDGKPTGSSVEVFQLMLNHLKSKKTLNDITFYPWARSYSILLNEPNSMLFVVTRTETREKLFKWVGPISKASNVIIGKKEVVFNPNSKVELERSNYCIVKNDAAGQLLKEKLGISDSKLFEVSEPKVCLQMLSADRVHFFAYDLNVAKFLMKELKEDLNKYESKFSLSEGEHYFAFHKGTSDNLINELQKTLNQIKKSKDFELIKKKYFEK